jgi:alpha-D-xyloside xylohydrolase
VFTLYEDDGLTYGYERGEFAEITLRWDDARRTLYLGARTGQFPGMLKERTFNIVVVSPKSPGSPAGPDAAGTVVKYTGDAVAAVIP